MKKAAILIRVSSEEQVKGNSLDEQEKKGKQYIKLNDWSYYTTYRDEGIGGDTLERPGLQQMLKDAEAKKYDVLVVYKIDRLSRSLKNFIEITEKLKSYGVEIKSVTEPFDTSNPIGKFMIQMIANFAEYERELIKERVYMGQLASMKNGRWKGSPPYGYDLKDGKLVINSKEAEVVKRIFKLLIDKDPDQRMPLIKIQNIVNSWKVETKLAHSKRKRSSPTFWDLAYIHQLLTNPVYTGFTYIGKYTRNPNPMGRPKKILRPKSEWIPYHSPPIISKEDFEIAQMELKKNAEFALRKSNGQETMINKILYCQSCGRKYSFYRSNKFKKPKIIYFCQGRKKRKTDIRCPSKSIMAWRIEDPLWEALQKMITHPSFAYREIKRNLEKEFNIEKVKKDIKVKESLLNSLNAQYERLVDIYIKGGIDEEMYISKITSLKRQKETVTRELFELKQEILNEDQVKKRLQKLREAYDKMIKNIDNLTYEEKCKITKLLVQKVETDGYETATAYCILPDLPVVLHHDQRVDNESKPIRFKFTFKLRPNIWAHSN